MYLPVDDDDMGSTSVFKCFLKLSRDTRLVAQQNPSQHRSFGVKLFAEHKEFIDQKNMPNNLIRDLTYTHLLLKCPPENHG
jgi:hypothetical protein